MRFEILKGSVCYRRGGRSVLVKGFFFFFLFWNVEFVSEAERVPPRLTISSQTHNKLTDGRLIGQRKEQYICTGIVGKALAEYTC